MLPVQYACRPRLVDARLVSTLTSDRKREGHKQVVDARCMSIRVT